jgi:hypothetical protein
MTQVTKEVKSYNFKAEIQTQEFIVQSFVL